MGRIRIPHLIGSWTSTAIGWPRTVVLVAALMVIAVDAGRLAGPPMLWTIGYAVCASALLCWRIARRRAALMLLVVLAGVTTSRMLVLSHQDRWAGLAINVFLLDWLWQFIRDQDRWAT